MRGVGVANDKPKYSPDASGGYNYSKRNSFQVTTDLLNSENLKQLLLSYAMSYRSAILLWDNIVSI